jgi:PWI domain
VPNTKEQLFSFPINWSIVIKNDILDTKLKPWLVRKTKEYLSEEEPLLISMILKKVSNKASPYEIIEKIKVVFEEETEVYIH